jgi:flagellar hook-associated protein 1 FlgK
MSSGLIAIGISALDAAQAGLTTTSHNISNVNTVGYSREAVIQSEALPVFTGAGYQGTGVQVQTIQRVFNSFQQQELVSAQAGSSQLDTYYAQLQQVDGLLGDPSSGLNSGISNFFNSIQAVANNPSDVPTRTAALGDAQGLASQINSLGGQLQQIGAGVTQQVQASIANINSYASQIASLNKQIILAQGSAGGQQPNDLLDQRDALISQLNAQIGATTTTQSDGSVNVFVGNGQSLVLGGSANSLSAIPETSDPNEIQLALVSSNSTTRIATSQITGGNLTGLLDFRDQVLIPTENQLGALATNLASASNAQNAVGVDLNGNFGAAIFQAGAAEVTGAASNSPSASVSASVTNATQFTDSNYRLQYNGAQYTVTRLSDNTVQTFATMPQTVDGVSFNVTSPMSAGDSFTIAPTANGATGLAVVMTDPTQIAAASAVVPNAAAGNTGSAIVTATRVAVPTPPATLNPNLQTPVNIVFQLAGGVTTYSLVDPTTNAVLGGGTYTPGSPISDNGWSITFSGSPASGDTYAIGATGANSTDNSNALLLGQLQTQPIYAGQSLSGAYQSIVTNIGSQTQQFKTTSAAQDNILTEATAQQQSTSGVNLDDEAANLLKYQQAYQAASQTIVTANSLFASILGIFSNLP